MFLLTSYFLHFGFQNFDFCATLGNNIQQRIYSGLFTLIFGFGTTLSGAQGVLLPLCPEIIPGRLRGIIWDAGDRIRVGHMQDKYHSCCAIAQAWYWILFMWPERWCTLWLRFAELNSAIQEYYVNEIVAGQINVYKNDTITPAIFQVKTWRDENNYMELSAYWKKRCILLITTLQYMSSIPIWIQLADTCKSLSTKPHLRAIQNRCLCSCLGTPMTI